MSTTHGLSLSEDGTYIIQRMEAPVTNEVALQRASAAAEFANEHGVFRLLSDVRGMPYTGTPFTHYEFAYMMKSVVPTAHALKVAVVASPDDPSHDFLQIAARTAHYDLKVFKDYEEAVRWLTETKD
ncbi:MAG TPA: hypothetical protein VGW12_06875 [Pyrinomonadaceae bacterium]|nr:hypothetical protein [Pyrinomonadaceae bacterium]